jgi:hypothetical protein
MLIVNAFLSIENSVSFLFINVNTNRASVESASTRRDPDPDSQRYNESILTALGEYSSSLPNFQVIILANHLFSFVVVSSKNSSRESGTDFSVHR